MNVEEAVSVAAEIGGEEFNYLPEPAEYDEYLENDKGIVKWDKFDLKAKNKEIAELAKAVEDLSPFERDFTEYWVKTGNKTQAAKLAGSTAKNPERVGWNTAAKDKVKRYFGLLTKVRCHAAALDATDILQMARTTYYMAIDKGNFKEANEATKILGEALNLFDKKPITQVGVQVVNEETKENQKDIKLGEMVNIIDSAKERL